MSVTDAPASPFLPALRTVLGDTVLEPGSAAYAEEVLCFNLRVHNTPDAVIAAESTADIAAAVETAAEFGVPVSLQATGHGASSDRAGGMLISTRRLADVRVDPAARTAAVGPGAKWDAVLAAAAPYGLAGLSGSAPDAGVVGYTLGGGLSPLARSYGFAADYVREIELVTPDGTVRRVDAGSQGIDGELFWGLRGGKSGMGVVTELVFDLLPIETLHGGGLYYDAAHAADVLRFWTEWVRTVPESVCTSVALLRLPPMPEIPEILRGRTVLHIRVALAENGAAEQALLAQLRQVAPVLLDAVGDMPFPAIGSIHADPVEPLPYWERGILLKDFDAELAELILRVAGPDQEIPLLLIEVRHLGGAIARQPEIANAAGGRDAAFQLFVVGLVLPDMPAGAVPRSGEAVLSLAAPWATGGFQINFLGDSPDPEAMSLAWPSDVHIRLETLRAHIDPAGIFRPGGTVADGVKAEPVPLPADGF